MITVNKANPTPGEITSSLTGSTGDGAGLHFDGAAGNIDIASPPDLGTKFSFEFVIKADSTGTSGKIVDFGDGGRFVIEHNTTGLQVKPSNAGGWVTLQSPSPLADLEVHHLVLTVDGTTATLYDNGNQVATDTISATDIDSCTDAKIGSYYDSATDLFAGTIYRCRFWNKVVDAKALFERADVDYSSQYGSQTNKFASPDTNWGTNAADATAFNAAYAWTSYQTSTISVSSNVVTFTTAADGRGIFANYSLTAGKRYRVTMATGAISGATYQLMTRTGSDYTSIGTLVASTTNVFDFTAPAGAYSGYLYLYQSGSGSGSIALTAASVTNELVQIGCVSDYDLAYAQPALSTLIQDRSGAADGVASSSGVAQVQPITQLNSTSARIGSTQLAAGTSPYIPADGELLASGNIGSGSADPNINGWGNAITIDNSDAAALEFAKSGTLYGFVGVQGAPSSHALDIAAFQSQDMRFRVGSNAGTTAITIDSTGNIRIGSQTSNIDNLLKLDVANGNDVFLGIRQADQIQWHIGQKASDTSLYFRSGNVGSETDRLTIDSTGNVSIGTAGTHTLHVQKDVDDYIAKFENDGNATTSNGVWIDTRWNTETNSLFKVTTNSGAQEVLNIDGTGLATFSGGIAFPAPDPASAGTPATSSVLDVYEEGTFTFTITGSSTAGTHSGILTQGNYTRVGNICTVMGYYYGTSGTGSGFMVIGGLPFPVKSGAAPVGTIQANSGFVVPSGSNPTIISAGSSTFKVRCTKEDGSAFTYASYPTDPEYIRFGVTYVI